MTEYYTNKSDFEKGDNLGWGENNVQQVVDLLKDIKRPPRLSKRIKLKTFMLLKVKEP